MGLQDLPNSRGARSCTWKAKLPKAPNCSYVRTTQNERSDGFTKFVTMLASAPFVVGYHWWVPQMRHANNSALDL